MTFNRRQTPSTLGKYFTAALSCTIFMLSIALSGASIAGTLNAQVDRNSVSLGEVIQFSLSYTGSASSNINTDVMGADFDVLSNSQSSSTQMSFGSSSSFSTTTQWRILLRPKRAGQLTIPAFVIDGDSSQPIQIEVKAAAQTTSNSNNNEPIYLETLISTAKPFEQEQVLLTIRLASEFAITDHDFEQRDPIIPDAKVERVYSGSYQRQANGRRQVVLEKIYAIYPQAPGALTIPSVPHAVIYQQPNPDPRRSSPFFNSGNRLRKDFESQVQTLHVQPKPAASTADQWLPAKKVSLRQHWSSAPERFVLGEPITRDITIEAQGLLASQLPEISMADIDGLKFYPDQPQLDNQLSNTGVTGTRSIATAIVASKPGRYTLPEITLQWWDISSNQQRQSTLAAVEIIVAAPAGSAITDDNALANTAPLTPAPDTATDTYPTDAVGLNKANSNAALVWKISSAFFALTTLVFFMLWRAAGSKTDNTTGTTKRVTPQVAVKSDTEKQLLKSLRHDCEAKSAQKIRTTLIKWAQVRWPDNKIFTLADISNKLAESPDRENFVQLIKELDALLYSNIDQQMAYIDIYQQAKQLKPDNSARKNKQQALKPLYS